MDAWRKKLLERLRDAKSAQQVLGVLDPTVRQLGLPHYRYTMALPDTGASLKYMEWHNLPLGPAADGTAAVGLHAAEPSVMLGSATGGKRDGPPPPTFGAEGLWPAWVQSSGPVSRFWGRLALLRAGPVGTLDLSTQQSRLSFLFAALHQAMLRTVAANHAWGPAPCLTEQEVEVLRWVADGKTGAEIADLLVVSENTVKFHIRNATGKLGAPNKTAAAVRATLLGLLH
jgi:DNA-binding CsgD family transcriptional regulator